MLTDEEDNLIDYLEEHYGCHTVIVCGSRAIGTHRPDSDWDIVALKSTPGQQWCHRKIEGVGDVNVLIYPEQDSIYNPARPSQLYENLNDFVRLRLARVLVQESNWGDALVRNAKDMYDRGIAPFPPSIDEQHRHYLYDEVLGAIDRESMAQPVRDLYVHRGLSNSLTIYFNQRLMWVLPPKQAYAYFKEHDPQAERLFTAAMAFNASPDDIRAWFDYIMTKKK